jgi:hypothetical protein
LVGVRFFFFLGITAILLDEAAKCLGLFGVKGGIFSGILSIKYDEEVGISGSLTSLILNTIRIRESYSLKITVLYRKRNRSAWVF